MSGDGSGCWGRQYIGNRFFQGLASGQKENGKYQTPNIKS
jgi:hypothetical protein